MGDDRATGAGELVPVEQAATTPMQLLEIAVRGGADLDQVSKLMDLQERWEKREAEKAYVRAMTAFKADPPVITKDKLVAFATDRGETSYTHASLGNICAAAIVKMSGHGLSHRWETEQGQGTVRVTCIITHELGHSERIALQGPIDPSGNKNAIQAIASAVTYFERYTLLAALGLAPEEDDDGRQGTPSGAPAGGRSNGRPAAASGAKAPTKGFPGKTRKLELADGEQDIVEGKILYSGPVYGKNGEPLTGKGKKGPWALFSIVLEAEEGDPVEVSTFNRTQAEDAFRAMKRGGVASISVEQKGQYQNCLSVDFTYPVETPDEAAAEEEDTGAPSEATGTVDPEDVPSGHPDTRPFTREEVDDL